MVHRKKYRKRWRNSKKRYEDPCRGSRQVLFASETPCEPGINFYSCRKSSNPYLGISLKFSPFNLRKTRLPRIRTFPMGWFCGCRKPCQMDPCLHWIGRSNDCNESGGFLGGKKWKKVENTVGESKSTKLSIWYYEFLFVYVAGLVGLIVTILLANMGDSVGEGGILNKKRARVTALTLWFHYGGRPGDRTQDLWFRRPTLYPLS